MHYFEKSNNKMTSLYVVYNAGSMYEADNQYGTMHLMEHLICKRFDSLQDKYTNLNIYFNAYTSTQQVIVTINGIDTALTQDIKTEFVKLLTDGTFTDAADFNKEKSIVMQEYYNCFNDISYGNSINYIRQKFNNYSGIGKKDDIINFSYDDALLIFNKFFISPSYIVEVSKSKSDFSFVSYNNIPLIATKIDFFDSDDKTLFEDVPSSDINSQIIFSPKCSISKKDFPLFNILIDILSLGLNSILYQELREKRGLIYGISPIISPCVNDSIFIYSIMTTPDNVTEVTYLLSDIFTNIEKYITESRFNDILSYLSIQMDINKLYKFSHPKHLDINLPSQINTKQKLKSIKLKDIINVAKKYFSDINISVF